MKKKNEPIEISTNAIVLIILGIIVLVILIIGFSFGWEKVAPWLSQDKFTITKKECWDKGNVIHSFREINLTLKKPEATSINKELIFYRTLQKSDLPNENWFDDGTSYRVIYEDEEKVIINVWLKTVRSEENIVCKPILVDGIEICEFELSIERCFEQEGYYFFEKNINESYCCNKIFKKELTTEWLDGNCGVIGIGEKCLNDNPKDYELKYKCEFKETYFVEIK